MLSPGSIWLLGAVLAGAPSAETVRLGLGDCVPSRDLVHDLVAIEIGFEQLADEHAALEVRVECHAREVSISLIPAVDGVPARRIAKSEVKKRDGARLVALNIVELLHDARGKLARAPVIKEPSRETVAVVVAPVANVVESSLRTRLSAAPVLRYLASGDRF